MLSFHQLHPPSLKHFHTDLVKLVQVGVVLNLPPHHHTFRPWSIPFSVAPSDLYNLTIRCCFHLFTKSNFTSAHSLTDQIKGAQEWVYLMGGTHAQTTSLILQQRILPVITASLSPTAAGRSLMGRNSGACDNYFHQCITSHLYRFGFKEYVICVSLSHSRPYIAK